MKIAYCIATQRAAKTCTTFSCATAASSLWVRSRLRAADRERAGEEMAFAARLGAGLDADVIAFDRAGSAWVLTLALAALPDVDTLYVWARELIALQETST